MSESGNAAGGEIEREGVRDHIERALHDLASLAAVALDAPVALITISTNTGERLEAVVSANNRKPGIAPRLSALLPNADRTLLVVPDASADSRLAVHPMVIGEPQIRFYLECPILFGIW